MHTILICACTVHKWFLHCVSSLKSPCRFSKPIRLAQNLHWLWESVVLWKKVAVQTNLLKVIYSASHKTFLFNNLLTHVSSEDLNQPAVRANYSLHCPHEEPWHTWLSKMSLLKIPIRLCQFASWSESSLGEHVRWNFTHVAARMPYKRTAVLVIHVGEGWIVSSLSSYALMHLLLWRVWCHADRED